MRTTRLLAAAAAAFLAIAPARADRLLPQGTISSSGDILFGAINLGKRQSGMTTLTPDALQIRGIGSTGDVSGMTTVPTAPAAPYTLARQINDLNTPVVSGLSASTVTVACTAYGSGTGFVLCPANHDFAIGQGVLIPGQGDAFGNYGAIAGLGTTSATGSDGTSPSRVVGTAGSTTRCYVLLPLDGLQGYGSPSNEYCVANAPTTPSPTSYVKLTWTNGTSPPPAYALYQGPSGGPYALFDYQDNAGANAAQYAYEYGGPYGRGALKPEFWLPSTVTTGQAGQRSAAHGIVSAVQTDNYVNVGVALPAAKGAPVTLYHDNALPIRNAMTGAASACVRIPLGSYPMSASNFSGSTITYGGNSKCLVGTDREGSRLVLMNGMIGAPILTMSGGRPILRNLTLTAGGFNAGNGNALVSIFSGTTDALLEDVSFPDVAKNAISNSYATNTILRRFYANSLPDFANQSTFIHSSHSINTQASEFSISGFGFDMGDRGCHIYNGTVSNFISAAVADEALPDVNRCVFENLTMTAAPISNYDINGLVTECVEVWGADAQVLNNRCLRSYGSAFSLGGARIKASGNFAGSDVSNAGAAFVLRMDSPTYNATGAVIEGNSLGAGYAYGLGTIVNSNTGARCTGCTIGANGFSAASTAPINLTSLTGAEIFTAPTPVTYAQLPSYHAAVTRGRRLFCTDCLAAGQSAGNGTGIEVIDNGSSWIRADGATTIH